jgi:hypothetical protein
MRLYNNSSFSHHYTEEHPETLSFLQSIFNAVPERISMSYPGDIKIDGNVIEIKSAQETTIVKKHWRTGKPITRRGYFQFRGHEKADYILFIGVRKGGELIYFIDEASKYDLGKRFCIPWRKIFGG